MNMVYRTFLLWRHLLPPANKEVWLCSTPSLSSEDRFVLWVPEHRLRKTKGTKNDNNTGEKHSS